MIAITPSTLFAYAIHRYMLSWSLVRFEIKFREKWAKCTLSASFGRNPEKRQCRRGPSTKQFIDDEKWAGETIRYAERLCLNLV